MKFDENQTGKTSKCLLYTHLTTTPKLSVHSIRMSSCINHYICSFLIYIFFKLCIISPATWPMSVSVYKIDSEICTG